MRRPIGPILIAALAAAASSPAQAQDKQEILIAQLPARPITASAAPALHILTPPAAAVARDIEDIFAALRRDQPAVAGIEARLAEIERGLPLRVASLEDRVMLRERIARVSSILVKLKNLTGAGADAALTHSLLRLTALLDADADNARLKRFEGLVDQLLAAGSREPATLGAIFDNMRELAPAAAAETVSAAGAVSAPRIAAGERYPQPHIELRTAAVPEQPRAEVADNRPAGDKLAEAWTAAVSPFAKLTAAGRRELFKTQRGQTRGRLFSYAVDALVESGAGINDAPDLDTADRAIMTVRRTYFQSRGLQENAADAQDEERRCERMSQEAPRLARYLAQRGLYQIYIQRALKDQAVAADTRFAAWELSLPDSEAVGFTFSRVEDDGRSFSGLRREFADGSTRFESAAGSEGLIIVGSPKDSREIRTRIAVDEKGKPVRTSTAIINTRRKKKIREEMQDIARALMTSTLYDEAGAAVRVETLHTGTKARSVIDYNKRIRIDTDEKGNTTITSLDGKQWTSQSGRLDEQGRFQLDQVVRADGSTVHFLGEHVQKIVDRRGSVQDYFVDLQQLFDGLKGEARREHSLKIAREIVKALGLDDEKGRRSQPLQNFLYDTFDDKRMMKGVKMRIDAQGNFTLVYDYQNGTQRIELAKWGASTRYKGNFQLALVVQRPIHTDAEGKGQVDPRRWREYLADGGQNQWHSRHGTEEAGWFSSAKRIENIYLYQYRFDGAKWRQQGVEHKDKIVNEAAGTSTFGIIGRGIHDSWGVGHVLKAGGWVGKSLYNGVVAGGQEIVYAISGDEEYGLEAAGGFANSPLMNSLLNDQGFIRRLSREQREVVTLKARQNREEALRLEGITRENTDYRDYQKLLDQPYSEQELMGALRNYGAGTYGSRLMEMAEEEEGWAKAGLTVAGGAMKFGENVGEMMCNPIIWVTMGAGAAVQSLNALKLAGHGTRWLSASAVPAALTGARITHGVLTSVLYGTWTVSGIDNFGQMVNAFKDGDHSDSWTKAADFGTDLFFLGAMARQGMNARAAQKAEARLRTHEMRLAKQSAAASQSIRTGGFKKIRAPQGQLISKPVKAGSINTTKIRGAKAPVKSARTGTIKTQTNIHSAKAPVKSVRSGTMKAKVDVRTAKAQPKTTPKAPAKAKVDVRSAKAQAKTTPKAPAKAKVDVRTAKAQPKTTPKAPAKAKVDVRTAKAQPKTTPKASAKAKVDVRTAKAQPKTTPKAPAKAKVDVRTAKAQAKTTPKAPAKAKMDVRTAKAKSKSGVREGQARAKAKQPLRERVADKVLKTAEQAKLLAKLFPGPESQAGKYARPQHLTAKKPQPQKAAKSSRTSVAKKPLTQQQNFRGRKGGTLKLELKKEGLRDALNSTPKPLKVERPRLASSAPSGELLARVFNKTGALAKSAVTTSARIVKPVFNPQLDTQPALEYRERPDVRELFPKIDTAKIFPETAPAKRPARVADTEDSSGPIITSGGWTHLKDAPQRPTKIKPEVRFAKTEPATKPAAKDNDKPQAQPASEPYDDTDSSRSEPDREDGEPAQSDSSPSAAGGPADGSGSGGSGGGTTGGSGGGSGASAPADNELPGAAGRHADVLLLASAPAPMPALIQVAAKRPPAAAMPRDTYRGAPAREQRAAATAHEPEAAKAVPLTPARIYDGTVSGYTGSDLSYSMPSFEPAEPYAGKTRKNEEPQAAPAVKQAAAKTTANAPAYEEVDASSLRAAAHKLPVSGHLPVGHLPSGKSMPQKTGLSLLTQLSILLSSILLVMYSKLPFIFGCERRWL
ncbi:MAG: hypothetical protein ABIJ96_10520 [Elusimicrobiota bacterium]